jgi:hypothetical protein
MAKEKADSDKRGWFARWRERRALKKQRAIESASEMEHRMYEQRNTDAERQGRAGGPRGGGV